MTVKEWREQNPDATYTMVWAADTLGGFGLKGHSVFGSREVTGRLEVIEIEMKRLAFPEPHDFPVLHVWDPVICKPLTEKGETDEA